MYNTIRLLKGEQRVPRRFFEKDFSKGDTIFGDDCEPVEIARWEAGSDFDLAEETESENE